MSPGILIVMGAAGSGKTTVGHHLADSFGWEFYDADSYHSAANIAKMKHGEPLSDADRAPWLAELNRLIGGWLAEGRKAVLACSALRQAYRSELVPAAAAPHQVEFVYLDVPPEVLALRLVKRPGHFLTATLLESQLATLEKPRAGQEAFWVDGTEPPAVIAMLVRQRFGLKARSATDRIDGST